MPARRAHPLPVLLAALVLLGHLAQTLHRAAHVHVYCATHDRVEHAGHAPGTGAGCDDAPAQPQEDEADGHASCPFLAPGLSAGDEPAPVLAARPAARPCLPAAPAPLLLARVLWPLAPKQSPPAAA